MKAFEARENSVVRQSCMMLRKAKEAQDLGKKRVVTFEFGALYPEVIECLTKEGYDVKIIRHDEDDNNTESVISWENATEPNREGTVTYIDMVPKEESEEEPKSESKE